MPALGLEVPKKEIDALFDAWDPDGSGEISFDELKKLLKQKAPGKPLNSLQGKPPVAKTLKGSAPEKLSDSGSLKP